MRAFILEQGLELKPMFVKPDEPLTHEMLIDLFKPMFTRIEENKSISESEELTYSLWKRWLTDINNKEQLTNCKGNSYWTDLT